MTILTNAKVYRTFDCQPGTGNPANTGLGNCFNILVTPLSSVTNIGQRSGAMLIVNSGPSDILFQLSNVQSCHITHGFGAPNLLQAGSSILYDEGETSPSTSGFIAMRTAQDYSQAYVTLIRGATSKMVVFEDPSLSANPLLPAANQPSVPFTYNTLTAGGTLTSVSNNGTFYPNVINIGGMIFTESLNAGTPE